MKRLHALVATLLLTIAPPCTSATSEAPDTQPLSPEQLHFRQQTYTALRIGGLVTTVGLVTLIALLLCREHRRHRLEDPA